MKLVKIGDHYVNTEKVRYITPVTRGKDDAFQRNTVIVFEHGPSLEIPNADIDQIALLLKDED